MPGGPGERPAGCSTPSPDTARPRPRPPCARPAPPRRAVPCRGCPRPHVIARRRRAHCRRRRGSGAGLERSCGARPGPSRPGAAAAMCAGRWPAPLRGAEVRPGTATGRGAGPGGGGAARGRAGRALLARCHRAASGRAAALAC